MEQEIKWSTIVGLSLNQPIYIGTLTLITALSAFVGCDQQLSSLGYIGILQLRFRLMQQILYTSVLTIVLFHSAASET